MAQIQPDVKRFMQEFGVSADEIWLVAGGKSYAIKHSALERIASEKAIVYGHPQIIEANGAAGICTILVAATMGAVTEWTFGEASPKNNKNAYPFAMAEKRAKDRCTLKLIKAHGSIYSEDEADELKQKQPGFTAPDEITMYVSRAQTEIENCETPDELRHWWSAGAEMRKALRIEKPSADYNTLYSAVQTRGKSLQSQSQIQHQEAAE